MSAPPPSPQAEPPRRPPEHASRRAPDHDAGQGPGHDSGQKAARQPLLALAAVVVWFGLWYLTPGLLSDGVGTWFTDDPATAILYESLLALVLVLGIIALHRRETRELFARDRTVWLYALPLLSGVVLPFHYGLELPVGLYMVWVTVSVIWQDYLTFGLLQKYLARSLPPWAVLIASAVIFWAGHALLLPDKFAPVHLVPSLAILALGLLLAGLRVRLGTLHLILALHLGFYFVFS